MTRFFFSFGKSRWLLGRERIGSPPFVRPFGRVPLVDVPVDRREKLISAHIRSARVTATYHSGLLMASRRPRIQLQMISCAAYVERLTIDDTLHLDDHATVLFIEPVSLRSLDRDRAVLPAARVDCQISQRQRSPHRLYSGWTSASP